MSAAHKRRGTRPPKAGRPWTAEEEALLRQLPPGEVARRIGRTLKAVYAWRRVLGVAGARLASLRMPKQRNVPLTEQRKRDAPGIRLPRSRRCGSGGQSAYGPASTAAVRLLSILDTWAEIAISTSKQDTGIVPWTCAGGGQKRQQ
jgi:hypothetical protein